MVTYKDLEVANSGLLDGVILSAMGGSALMISAIKGTD